MSGEPGILEIQTTSVEQTRRFGERLGQALDGGLVIALIGGLGAGKTQLVKGIATGNGASDSREITSPTFTLLHEHAGRLTLYHIDAYRLSGPVELFALGFDELVAADAVVAIEWADRVAGAIPDDHLRIQIESRDTDVRRFRMDANGAVASRFLASVRRSRR